jgi:hypothetical protein
MKQPFDPDDEDDDEDSPEGDGEVLILAQDEDELDAEMSEAREFVLEDVRQLIDELVQGMETVEETLRELRIDLADWESDLENNPFAPDHPHLAAAWNDATNTIRDGYRLIIMGIERDQPEFFQAGYTMIEDGVYGRDAVLNAD